MQLFYISVIPCLELQMSSFKYFGCCLTFKTLQHGVCRQGSCFCLHPELQFCLTDFLNIFIKPVGAKTKPRRIQGVWEHFPLEIFFTSQGSEIASELRSVFNQNISTICVLSVISVALYSATKHGHHIDVVSAIAALRHSLSQAERARTTDQNDGKIHAKIGLTCNQMGIFLYPAHTKEGGLSSLDQNFRGAIAPVAPMVPPPLHKSKCVYSFSTSYLQVQVLITAC